MTKTYIAVGSVGHFLPGDEIKGLDADRIQALLASGAIEEVKEPEQAPVDNSATEIAELKAELKEALGKASQAEAQNIAYVKEIAALKAEIAELKQPKVPADGDAQPATTKAAKAK